MEKRVTLILASLFLFIGMAMAQTKVSGTVVSHEDGQPVIGATVQVPGTNQGTVTDVNGKFELSIPEGKSTIRVTYVGMEPVEVTARGTKMRIELTSDAEALDEVIVVGYGTQRREAKTGSITTVSSKEIAEIPATSFDKMLAGKMAGVQVTQQSGQPGSTSQIRVRGTSSITAGNNPLYVVDGIAIQSFEDNDFTNTNNPLATINPNDIESITVLKDAAAASVYGSRAANGVILITTKSGKEGKSKFTVRAKYGVSQLANDNDFGLMTGQQLLEYQRQAILNAGKNPDDPTAGANYYRPYELLTRPQTNWMDHMTRTGHLQEYEITMTGGTGKTTYYNSLSFHDNEGVYYGVKFQRLSGRINVDHELNSKLKTGTRTNLAYNYGEDVPMQDLYYANPAFAGMTILPWSQAYTADGKHNTAIDENSNSNPRATAEYDDQWQKKYYLNSSIYLQWQPIKPLTLKTTNGIEFTTIDGRRYWSNEAHNYQTGYPKLQTTQTKYYTLTTSNTATWQDTYFDQHSIRLLLGQEASKFVYEQNYQYSQYLNPQIPYLPSGNANYLQADLGLSNETMLSWFGILDYNYASRYFLQASIRWDGSSLFGENHRWGMFWSVGGSWNIHNEAFMQSLTWLNTLKLRASYGVNGNNNISAYRAFGTYTSSVYNGITGMRPSTPANPDLSWEKNKAWNFGLDFRFLKRFSGSIDVYSRKTTDMLLYKSQSSTSGFNSALQNIGSMRNTGVEFQFDAEIINKGDWAWNAGFNIAHNKSKVLELAGEEMLGYTDPAGDTYTTLQHIVGEKLLTYYLRDYYGVNPVNGEALWRTESGELTNDYNSAAYIKAGSPEPTITGGFNTTLSWKNISLSIVTEFKAGNKVLIGERRYLLSDGNQMSMNQSTELLNYWKKPGDTGVMPKPVAGNSSNSYAAGSTRMLQKGDYLRLKDVTLSYDFDKKLLSKIGINSAKIYGSALNLYTFHDVHFWDPERGTDGMGYGIYPVTKTFVIGLDLSF